VKGALREISNRVWFGVIVVTVATAVSSALVVPAGSHPSFWTRVEFAVLGALVGIAAAFVVGMVLRAVFVGGVRPLWRFSADKRLGQRCIEIAREVLELYPPEADLTPKKRGAPMTWITAERLKEKQEAARPWWFDPANEDSRRRVVAEFERQGISAKVFRVAARLAERGHISEAERNALRAPPHTPLELGNDVVVLSQLGVRLGGKI
jgi:hypothetical protein